MSNLLIDDRPIMFLPMLAKALGSCERAIVLQQIHWLSRLPNSGVWEQGYHWVWGTYEEWCRDYFTMWQPRTLRMHVKQLEAMGVLISEQLRAHLHDQTKFYRVNYVHDLLAPMRQDHVTSSLQDHAPSSEHDRAPSINRTKTSAKTTQEREKRPPRAQGKNPYRPDEYSDIILG